MVVPLVLVIDYLFRRVHHCYYVWVLRSLYSQRDRSKGWVFHSLDSLREKRKIL